MSDRSISNSDGEGARLSIADVIHWRLERQLEAAGVTIVYTPMTKGSAHPWFRCPNTSCERRCRVLYLARGNLVCRACAATIQKTRGVPPASTRGGVVGFIAQRPRSQPARRSIEPLEIEGAHQPSRAMRVGKPRRELAEKCRRLHVNELLARHGLPVFDERSQKYVCRIGKTFRIGMRMSTPGPGRVRWWFACPVCQARCAVLYSPRSLKRPELRCRACWGLSYQSQLK